MPIYEMECPKCHNHIEKLLPIDTTLDCCGEPMKKLPSFPMVKYKGEGGYPSRKKQVYNTTNRIHPQLKPDANKKVFGGIK
jgi:predicted nucleic acid-binding Zn ribbon protein